MSVYLIIVIVLLIVMIGFDYHFRVRKRLTDGPKGCFLLGIALEMLVTPVELFKLGRKYAKIYKDTYSFNIFNIICINLMKPEDIESVISSSKNKEKSFFYNFLRLWLRDGLLLSKGQKWHDRRKILTPTFHFNILRNFCSSIDDATKRMVDALRDHLDSPIDVIPVVTEYTLITTCDTAMGTRLSSSDQQWKSYKKGIYNLRDILLERFTKAFMYIDFIHYFTENYRKLNDNVKIVHKFSKNIIMNRKEKLRTKVDTEKINIFKNKTTAMLDLLIAAENEGLIDEKGIQEEVDTFMFEGHDTTAAGLSFCLMLLANNNHVQEKIVKELTEIYDDTPRALTLEDLSKMSYLECCIKESLRLYPPVHIINRVISEVTKIAGQNVPVGTLCNIHIYDLHRREDLFPNPELFDPDRFLPENSHGRHPYAYIPFSAGPRNCIGQRFAMMVMKSAISGILQQYRLLPVSTPSNVELMSDIVLRSTGPIQVTFVKRQQ